MPAQTDLMSVVNLGLSVAAILFALVAIACEVLFYMSQTRLNKSIADENAKFAQQMTGLLGELRGLSTVTQERLTTQQDKMLEAFIKRTEPATENALRAEMSEQLSDIRDQLETVSSAQQTSEATKTGLAAVMEKVTQLEDEMPAIARRIAENVANSSNMSPASQERSIVIGPGHLTDEELYVLETVRHGEREGTLCKPADTSVMADLRGRGLVEAHDGRWFLTPQGNRVLGTADVEHPDYMATIREALWGNP